MKLNKAQKRALGFDVPPCRTPGCQAPSEHASTEHPVEGPQRCSAKWEDEGLRCDQPEGHEGYHRNERARASWGEIQVPFAVGASARLSNAYFDSRIWTRFLFFRILRFLAKRSVGTVIAADGDRVTVRFRGGGELECDKACFEHVWR